ncbi:CGGC domain-containing protein [Thermanaeromonas sp. C210]|uniref:CGGC domain-containing protein n=1 Tax=Thermanaeromonas sp. C210 TaxID=2731925 RepID=UPI00155BE5AA|nr:CGGC domain-containing protein [Thermanaeromonas sp. C210]GFN22911.1 CGGC domain-containing protein [Thermanaeromonas sp. C210]
MARVGIIACRHYWYHGCPGFQSHILCFLAQLEQKGPLGRLRKGRIVSLRPCPGCPGDRITELAADMLAQDNVQVFALASCLFLAGHCPEAVQLGKKIEAAFGRPVLMGTYIAADKAVGCRSVRRALPGIPSVPECLRQLGNLSYWCSLPSG